MSKFFNTSGPINVERHYFIPVAQRIDVQEIFTLVDQEKYFVIHAPRQSGKTTALKHLRQLLHESGRYKCLYVNVEAAQSAREDVSRAMMAILKSLAESEQVFLNEDVITKAVPSAPPASPDTIFADVLSLWARSSPLPTVLLIDEIDSLIGDSLVSVLRQLRSRYDARPKDFPQSVILCGVRDVRDYRIQASSEKAPLTGGSCFNINSESLLVGPLIQSEVVELYRQHTEATGQIFAPEALSLAYSLTNGQPWLVNALAFEACFKDPRGRDRTQAITAELIMAAKESLIQRRVTHLDQLADKLQEPRVRSVIEPMVLGKVAENLSMDAVEYVIDLGLVVNSKNGLQIANPIYNEVIPRQLTWLNQTQLKSIIPDLWYINPDGSLAVEKLLQDFQQFFRENSESWIQRFTYLEAGPQLLLQAFLQRVVNGGGRIDREYGLGRGRTDLLLTWPYGEYHHGKALLVQKVVFELKLQHKTKDKTLAEGLKQIKLYLDRVGEKSGHLLIFDRDPKRSWDEKIYREEHEASSSLVTVWGM